MPKTWLNDVAVEFAFKEAVGDVDREFGAFFQSQALSNEERLTGVFVQMLRDRLSSLSPAFTNWGTRVLHGPCRFILRYIDTTAQRKETVYGADLALVLSVDIPNVIQRTKAIFIQSKKMNCDPTPSGISFHDTWNIDSLQLGNLLNVTSSSYYFLYSPSFLSTNAGVQVVPASTVRAILRASTARSVIHTNQIASLSRNLTEFIVDEFIASWAGDESREVVGVAMGQKGNFVPHHLIDVKIDGRPT